MRRFFFFLVILGGFITLGFFRWPVAGPLNWLGDRWKAAQGWHLEVAQATWIPWRQFHVRDLKLTTPLNSRFHITELRIRCYPGSIFTGNLTTRWYLGELRIDPASFGIRRPLAQELLSVGPVATHGSAILQMGIGRLDLKALTLQGSMLQFHAQGWLKGRHQADFTMEGALPRRLLQAMALMEPDPQGTEGWEPFTMRLNGALKNPNFSFVSKFSSFTMTLRGGQRL